MWHSAVLDLYREEILPTVSNFVPIRVDLDNKITVPVCPTSTEISQHIVRKNMLKDFVPVQV